MMSISLIHFCKWFEEFDEVQIRVWDDPCLEIIENVKLVTLLTLVHLKIIITKVRPELIVIFIL